MNLNGIKRAAINLVLVGFGLVLFFLALEAALRLFVPQPLSPVASQTDPVTGYRHRPHIRGLVSSPEFSVRFETNSLGLRDQELSLNKAAGTYRILVLGDSFTFGWGVELSQTYPKVLEASLNRWAGQAKGVRYEVINAGVGGWGTAHELAYFQVEGIRFQPDLVILGFFHNDYCDNISSGLFSLENGELVQHPAPADIYSKLQRLMHWLPLYPYLAQNSHALNFIRCKLVKARETQRYRWRNASLGGASRGSPPKLSLTKALVSRFYRLCQERDIGFLLFHIPDRTEVDGGSSQSGPLPRLNSKLWEYLEQEDIPFVDPRPSFRQAFQRQPIFFELDRHMNSTAHSLAAGVLFNYLVEKILAPPPQGSLSTRVISSAQEW